MRNYLKYWKLEEIRILILDLLKASVLIPSFVLVVRICKIFIPSPIPIPLKIQNMSPSPIPVPSRSHSHGLKFSNKIGDFLLNFKHVLKVIYIERWNQVSQLKKLIDFIWKLQSFPKIQSHSVPFLFSP